MSTSDPSAIPENCLLAALLLEDYQFLVPYLEFVTLPIRQILYREGKTTNSVYFPCASMVSKLLRYSDLIYNHAIRMVACNRLHTVEERLAPWLLVQDLISAEEFPLMQEFISNAGSASLWSHASRRDTAKCRHHSEQAGQNQGLRSPEIASG